MAPFFQRLFGPHLDEAAIRKDERRRVAEYLADVIPAYQAIVNATGAAEFRIAIVSTQQHIKDILAWDGVETVKLAPQAPLIEKELRAAAKVLGLTSPPEAKGTN
jgi:hypothetical protein